MKDSKRNIRVSLAIITAMLLICTGYIRYCRSIPTIRDYRTLVLTLGFLTVIITLCVLTDWRKVTEAVRDFCRDCRMFFRDLTETDEPFEDDDEDPDEYDDTEELRYVRPVCERPDIALTDEQLCRQLLELMNMSRKASDTCEEDRFLRMTDIFFGDMILPYEQHAAFWIRESSTIGRILSSAEDIILRRLDYVRGPRQRKDYYDPNSPVCILQRIDVYSAICEYHCTEESFRVRLRICLDDAKKNISRLLSGPCAWQYTKQEEPADMPYCRGMHPWSEPITWILSEKIRDPHCCMILLETCCEYLDFLYGRLEATGKTAVLDPFVRSARKCRKDLTDYLEEHIS